jgi:phosphonate transport system ATP-binding protein
MHEQPIVTAEPPLASGPDGAPPVFLSVRGLSKSYGDHAVLRDVSLDVRGGEFVVVLGPSGTGKSTLFRCMTRLAEPDAGEVLFEGTAMGDLNQTQLARLRRGIGFIFQQFNLVRRLSAIDNVLAGRLGHVPLWRVLSRRFAPADRRRALECLDAVGTLEHAYKRVDGLSGGQQQRVAIARALAQESHVIIADEPIASLDPETAKTVLGILRRVTKDRGIPVLCSLHQVELALRVADRIVGFKGGRIVVDCPADQFTEEDHMRIYGRDI